MQTLLKSASAANPLLFGKVPNPVLLAWVIMVVFFIALGPVLQKFAVSIAFKLYQLLIQKNIFQL